MCPRNVPAKIGDNHTIFRVSFTNFGKLYDKTNTKISKLRKAFTKIENYFFQRLINYFVPFDSLTRY